MDTSTTAIRLKHFLNFVGMSSCQFADECGISRPTFSQMVSGRNKKLSDQTLLPIHRRFPQLSLVWLMFGEGEMLVEGVDAIAPGGSENVADCSDNSSCTHITDTMSDDIIRHDDMFSVDNEDTTGLNSARYSTESVSNNSTKYNTDNCVNDEAMGIYHRLPPLSHSRRVVRITLYYDDNTYETFDPR